MVLKDEHQETKGHEYEFHVKYNTCCPSDRYLSVDFIVKGSDDRFECRYRSHTHIFSDMGVLINARRGHTQSITHIPIKSGKEVDK